MAFCYPYVVRFRDTDAAGVVFFAHLLAICHQAYEASLGEAGIDLGTFFSAQGELAVPIIHATADFKAPLRCGDRLWITGYPVPLGESRFEVQYQVQIQTPPPDRVTAQGDSPAPDQGPDHRIIQSPPQSPRVGDRPAATALTRHCCISTHSRRPHPLPPALHHWLTLTSTPE